MKYKNYQIYSLIGIIIGLSYSNTGQAMQRFEYLKKQGYVPTQTQQPVQVQQTMPQVQPKQRVTGGPKQLAPVIKQLQQTQQVKAFQPIFSDVTKKHQQALNEIETDPRFDLKTLEYYKVVLQNLANGKKLSKEDEAFADGMAESFGLTEESNKIESLKPHEQKIVYKALEKQVEDLITKKVKAQKPQVPPRKAKPAQQPVTKKPEAKKPSHEEELKKMVQKPGLKQKGAQVPLKPKQKEPKTLLEQIKQGTMLKEVQKPKEQGIIPEETIVNPEAKAIHKTIENIPKETKVGIEEKQAELEQKEEEKAKAIEFD